MVARCRIELQSEARRPSDVGDCIAAERPNSPCADRFAADTTLLLHAFEVPIESMHCSDVMDIFVAAVFFSRTTGELSVVVAILGEGSAQFTIGDIAMLHTCATISKM